MAGNESYVAGVELEKVVKKVPTLFDRDDTFFSQLEKKPVEKVSARSMRIPLEMRPGGKFGLFNSDGGDLGLGDMPFFDKAIINTIDMKFGVQWTARTMWATDDNRKAVIDAFKRNMATAMKEFRRQVDSQCMTDGTGTLGTITTVSTANGVDTYTCTTDGFGVRLLRFGQDLNVFSPNLLTRRAIPTTSGETTVTFYDLANKTISVTPSVTGVTAGDLIVVSGATSTPPIGLLGVKYHNSNASTGVWLGFDRSLNPEIRANGVTANGSALTLPLPRLAINKIGDRLGIGNEKKRLTAWTHPAQYQAYEELGFNVTRIDKSPKEEGLNLYFDDNMKLAGAPLKKDFSWDRTRIDFIDLDLWGRAEMHAPGFYKNPTSNNYVWELRGGSGGVAAAWITYITASFNLYVGNPAGASYISALAVPPGY